LSWPLVSPFADLCLKMAETPTGGNDVDEMLLRWYIRQESGFVVTLGHCRICCPGPDLSVGLLAAALDHVLPGRVGLGLALSCESRKVSVES
jgi:hypothetical protein